MNSVHILEDDLADRDAVARYNLKTQDTERDGHPIVKVTGKRADLRRFLDENDLADYYKIDDDTHLEVN